MFTSAKLPGGKPLKEQSKEFFGQLLSSQVCIYLLWYSYIVYLPWLYTNCKLTVASAPFAYLLLTYCGLCTNYILTVASRRR